MVRTVPYDPMRGTAFIGPMLLILLRSTGDAGNILPAPVPWSLEETDIRGGVVNAERLRGHVTLVTFTTRATRHRAMRLGQEAGTRFGGRPGYLSLTLVNLSRLPFMLRRFARRGVAAAEQEVIEEALARERARGNQVATEADVRKQVIFVHDADGRTWRALGVPPKADALHVGVIDPTARLVYLARDPIDEAELFAVLDAELTKLQHQ